MEIYDYGIIGGGPGGYIAGMMLAKQGKKVVLFEKDKLGGTCLNRGCIPTKAIMHMSEIYSELKNADSIGINCKNVTLDFEKVRETQIKIVDKIRKSLELVVKNSGVVTVYEEASIKNENIIIANNQEYQCGKIIVSTGSKPRVIKGLEPDGKFILDSDDILNLNELPNSIVIIGSGAIGLEWARILHNFGVEVTLIEMAEHLIPLADIEVSKRIERIFKQRKIKYYLNDCVEKAENGVVTLKSGISIETDMVLSAVGRVPLRPDNSNVQVIGDACGEIQLAHYAIHQAKQLATDVPFDKNIVPAVIYGEPEIAWVGLREQDADETYKKMLLPITALGKAWCDNSTDGFIKVITKNDEICGAHIISKEASSLIHIFVIAIQNKILLKNLQKVCFAHPTYAEGIFELAMQVQ